MSYEEERKQKYAEYLESVIIPETYELSEEDYCYTLMTPQKQTRGSFFDQSYEVSDFDKIGIAQVYDMKKRLYNHMDCTGQLVDEWKEYKSEFQPICRLGETFTFSKGEVISALKKKYIKSYSDGMFAVGKRKDYYTNLVTSAGNVLFEEDFYDRFDSEVFYLFYSPVTKTVAFQLEGQQIFVCDLLGNRLNTEMIEGTFMSKDDRFFSKPGLYLMKKKMKPGEGSHYQIVTEDGAILDESRDFSELKVRYEKIEVEMRDGCYLYQLENGTFCDWIPINHAITIGKNYYTYNFRDANGNKILAENFRQTKDQLLFKDCVQYYGGVEKPKVKLRFSSYRLETPKKNYHLDYQPLRDYGSYVLCMDHNRLFLYDKAKQNYQLVTKELKPRDILFIDQNKFSFLNQMYLVQSTQVVDISQLKLTNYTRIQLSDPLEPVLNYDSFVQAYQENPQLIERKNLEKKKREQEILVKEYEQQQLQKQQLIEENNAKIGEMLENVVRLIQLNNSLDNEMVTVRKHIPPDILFVEKEDHLELNPMFLLEGFLRYVDLSSVSFDRIKVSGINFSGTNAAIDPQTVYQKDMSNGVYDGLNFNLKSFDGVNTKNSSFRNCIMDFVVESDLRNVRQKRKV